MVKDHIIHNYSALCALLVPTPLLVGRSTLDFLVSAFHASSPGEGYDDDDDHDDDNQ